MNKDLFLYFFFFFFSVMPSLSYKWRSLPLCFDCCSVSVVPIGPTLIMRDDTQHEGLIISGMLTDILTDFDIMFFLLSGQQVGGQTWQRHAIFISDISIACMYQYDRPTTSAILLTVLQQSSCTSWLIFSTFMGVTLMVGFPDCSSSSRDILLLLKHQCHSKHCIWPIVSLL